jgi:hypothetical protein
MVTKATSARSAADLNRELSGRQLLESRVVLTLSEFCRVMHWDMSTVLRKEKKGPLPPRRLVGGSNVFLTVEVVAWLSGAAPSDGVNPGHSERSRRAARARNVALQDR